MRTKSDILSDKIFKQLDVVDECLAISPSDVDSANAALDVIRTILLTGKFIAFPVPPDFRGSWQTDKEGKRTYACSQTDCVRCHQAGCRYHIGEQYRALESHPFAIEEY